MTTPAGNRDLAPLFHLAAGLALILGLGVARMFGLFDVGAGPVTALMLFPALVFIVGQPRGRGAWLIAALAALLIIVLIGIGVPGFRSLLDQRSGLELLPPLAGMMTGVIAIGIVRDRSGPAPARSPGNPGAWKPVTRWGVLSGLALGAAVFAMALPFWSRWTAAYPEIRVVAGIVAFLPAILAGGLAAVTTIFCRPSDPRSGLSSALAGLAVAVLTIASLQGGTALILALLPGREVLQAMHEAVVLSAVLIVPAMYVATWTLGRQRGPSPDDTLQGSE